MTRVTKESDTEPWASRKRSTSFTPEIRDTKFDITCCSTSSFAFTVFRDSFEYFTTSESPVFILSSGVLSRQFGDSYIKLCRKKSCYERFSWTGRLKYSSEYSVFGSTLESLQKARPDCQEKEMSFVDLLLVWMRVWLSFLSSQEGQEAGLSFLSLLQKSTLLFNYNDKWRQSIVDMKWQKTRRQKCAFFRQQTKCNEAFLS